MRIAILGSGALGGYFGARLAAAGTDVTFIARGAHLAAMQKDGLRLESPKGNLHLPQVNATDDPASIGPVDIVFFTVKLYDTEPALHMLPPLIGPQTLVIPFQNGVESVDVLTRAVGKSHVAGGTAYITAVVAEPGFIRHTAMDRLTFGPLSGPAPPILEELRDKGKLAGFSAELSENIRVAIWAKFVRLTVFSGMTAVTRCPLGPIREDPELRAMMQTAFRESVLVARAKQIPLPATIAHDIEVAMDTLPPHAKASMLEDLERGRPLELPWLSGAVVRIAGEVGVDVPTHHLIVTLLKPHVNGKRSA